MTIKKKLRAKEKKKENNFFFNLHVYNLKNILLIKCNNSNYCYKLKTI
jgi:hypothetical protein